MTERVIGRRLSCWCAPDRCSPDRTASPTLMPAPIGPPRHHRRRADRAQALLRDPTSRTSTSLKCSGEPARHSAGSPPRQLPHLDGRFTTTLYRRERARPRRCGTRCARQSVPAWMFPIRRRASINRARGPTLRLAPPGNRYPGPRGRTSRCRTSRCRTTSGPTSSRRRIGRRDYTPVRIDPRQEDPRARGRNTSRAETRSRTGALRILWFPRFPLSGRMAGLHTVGAREAVRRR